MGEGGGGEGSAPVHLDPGMKCRARKNRPGWARSRNGAWPVCLTDVRRAVLRLCQG